MSKSRRNSQKSIVILDTSGKEYYLQDIADIVGRSRSWAYEAHRTHGCQYFQDFIRRAEVARIQPKKITKTTIDLKDIPNGSWEQRNYKLPAANPEKDTIQIMKKIRIEEAGAKRKKRNVSVAHMSSALAMLEACPVIKETPDRSE